MEVCKKGLKDEQNRVKQLEVTLRQLQSELDQRFEDIRGLKDQAHKERHNGDLERLLDQKETFLRDLLDGPDHTLLHNLLKDAQYWRERHARLTQFVEHAMEDLPELLKEAFVVVFSYNVPWVVFPFVFVCRVVFDRVKVELIIAHRVDS